MKMSKDERFEELLAEHANVKHEESKIDVRELLDDLQEDLQEENLMEELTETEVLKTLEIYRKLILSERE